MPIMGITKKALKPVVSALFSSVQSDLLGLLYGQPDREFMGADLIRQIGRGTGAVHRQLRQFTSSGLVTVKKRANQTWYQADSRNPIFPELRGIVLKTTGLAEPLRQALAPFAKEIVAAFVFGSIAAGRAGPTSDVDLMILTDDVDAFSYSELFEALGPVERTLARPVNPTLMSLEAWQRKRATEGSFAARIAAGPKLILLGSEDEIA